MPTYQRAVRVYDMSRVLKFETPEILDKKIAEYLKFCEEKDKMPTKGGLALFLNTNKETLGDYAERDGYADSIKAVYGIIEDAWVQRLKGQSVAGVIFYLKNAFKADWRDRSEQETTMRGEVSLSIQKINYIVPALPEKEMKEIDQ